jgi:hypothetical protein
MSVPTDLLGVASDTANGLDPTMISFQTKAG